MTMEFVVEIPATRPDGSTRWKPIAYRSTKEGAQTIAERYQREGKDAKKTPQTTLCRQNGRLEQGEPGRSAWRLMKI